MPIYSMRELLSVFQTEVFLFALLSRAKAQLSCEKYLRKITFCIVRLQLKQHRLTYTLCSIEGPGEIGRFVVILSLCLFDRLNAPNSLTSNGLDVVRDQHRKVGVI